MCIRDRGVTTRKTMTGFLIVYSLTSDGRYTGDFLSNYAYINIQNELLKIDGVGKVDIMGAGEYAMRIWLKPDLLDYYKISLDEVFAAVEAQGGIFPAGKFGGEPAAGDVAYTYTVTMPPQIYDAEQFGDIVISTTPEGEQVRLSDIADVALGSASTVSNRSSTATRPPCLSFISNRAAMPSMWAIRSRPKWSAFPSASPMALPILRWSMPRPVSKPA